MSSYGSGGGIDYGSSQEKGRVMEQVRNQIAVATLQELIMKMSDKCFRKCVSSPSTSLDNREQKCLGNCMDRYMESWNIVSRAYSDKLRKDSGQH